MIWNGYGSVYTVLREGSVTVRAAKTTAGSEKLDGTGTPKRFLRLHEGKETEKCVRNQFLSDPFLKRTATGCGPFQERIGYEWNG